MPNNCLAIATIVLSAVCLPVFAADAAAADDDLPQIPVLNWTPRSDWVSVKDYGAVGDGKADDTAAIQAACDKVAHGSVLYLPAGTYRVTKSVKITGAAVGVSVIGHGRDTTLVWDGEEGGVIWVDDGIAHCRYIGLSFEGRGKASIGFHHVSFNRFETEVRHHHLAFRGFTEAGIMAEPKDKYALSEPEFNNCLFVDCVRGVSFTKHNDYNFTFVGCEFYRCGIAINCSRGNFYARDCHFEGSTIVDIWSGPEHNASVRRCTSVGSKAFVRHHYSVSSITIEDCHVEGWTDPNGAVQLAGAPVVVFDCVFTNGPEGAAPISVGGGQPVVVSGNLAPDAPSVVDPNHSGRVYEVPAGKRKGSIASAHRKFLKAEARVPGKVFDVKADFGAKGDGSADDTAAIQKAIDAAREHGNGAIAYVPSGRYKITDTLMVTGSDYYIGGTGFSSALMWRGEENGTMMRIHDPQDITLEHIAIGNHDAGAMNNSIDTLQTSSGKGSRMVYDGVFVFGMYQKKPFTKGMMFRELGENDVVIVNHVQGNVRIHDCAPSTMLFNCSYEGSITVEGERRQGNGFLGFMTRLATVTTHGLYLRDNQNIVMSDFYVEQALDGLVFEGKAGQPRGRATIQGAKVDFTHGGKGQDGMVVDSRNYAGDVFIGPQQYYASLPRVPVKQEGASRFDLYLWASPYYRTFLDTQPGENLHVHRLANKIVALDTKAREYSDENLAVDNMSDVDIARLADALDDLRRLGEIDLKLNHSE